MRHGLTQAGRYLVVRTRLGDRPGELIKLLQLVAEERANVVSVEHHREGMRLPIGQTEVELTLAMRDKEHCDALQAALAERGYPAEASARQESASRGRLVFLKHKPLRPPARPGHRAGGRGCGRSSGRDLRRAWSPLP